MQNFPTWLPPLSIMLLLFLGNGGYGTLIWVSQTKPPHVAASFLNYAAYLPWQRWMRNTYLGKPNQTSPRGCFFSQLCCFSFFAMMDRNTDLGKPNQTSTSDCLLLSQSCCFFSLPSATVDTEPYLGKLNQISPNGCHSSPSCYLSNCSLQGTGSRDGLKLTLLITYYLLHYLHSWACLGRFLKMLAGF